MSQVDQPGLFWLPQFGSIFRLVHSVEFQGVLYHRIANFLINHSKKVTAHVREVPWNVYLRY